MISALQLTMPHFLMPKHVEVSHPGIEQLSWVHGATAPTVTSGQVFWAQARTACVSVVHVAPKSSWSVSWAAAVARRACGGAATSARSPRRPASPSTSSVSSARLPARRPRQCAGNNPSGRGGGARARCQARLTAHSEGFTILGRRNSSKPCEYDTDSARR